MPAVAAASRKGDSPKLQAGYSDSGDAAGSGLDTLLSVLPTRAVTSLLKVVAST